MKNIFDLKVYKIYNVNSGCVLRVFDTLEELLVFVAGAQKTNSFWGEYRKGLEKDGCYGYFNIYLDNINMNFSDTKIHKELFKEAEIVVRDYMFFDPDNRIIDLRNYVDDIVKYSKANTSKKRNQRWWRYSGKDLPEFRKGPVPGTRKSRCHRGSYYRNPSVMNAKRDAAITEYKEYIRPSRRVINLPDPWDEYPRHIDKSWKTNSKKKKQWM